MENGAKKESRRTLYDTEELVGAPTEATVEANSAPNAQEALDGAKRRIEEASADAVLKREARAKASEARQRELETQRLREGERASLEEKRAKKVYDESIAAMTYAEEYRKRLKEEKEKMWAAKKQRAEAEAEAARQSERERQEEEILANTQRAREDAKERSRRAWDLLTRVDKSVSVVKREEKPSATAGEEPQNTECSFEGIGAEDYPVREDKPREGESFAPSQVDADVFFGDSEEMGAINAENVKDGTEREDEKTADGFIRLDGAERASFIHIEGMGVSVGITPHTDTGAQKSTEAAVYGASGYSAPTAASGSPAPTEYVTGSAAEKEPRFVFIPSAPRTDSDFDALNGVGAQRLRDEAYLEALKNEKKSESYGGMDYSVPIATEAINQPFGYSADAIDGKGKEALYRYDAARASAVPDGGAVLRSDGEAFNGQSRGDLHRYDGDGAISEELGDFSFKPITKSPGGTGLLSDKDMALIKQLEEKENHSAPFEAYSDGSVRYTGGASVLDVVPSEADVKGDELVRFAEVGDRTKESQALSDFNRRRSKEEEKELLRFAENEAKRDGASGAGVSSGKEQNNPPQKTDVQSGISATVDTQIRNDRAYIKERFAGNLRQLKLQKSRAALRFGEQSKKDKRSAAKNRYDITNSKRDMKKELKYEKLDNDRYYYLVLLNLSKAKLPKKTNPERLKLLREELMTLLNQRDEINRRLCELYLGKDKSVSASDELLDKWEAKGMRRCFKKHRGLVRKMERMHVEVSKKQQIFRIIDGQVEIAGKIGRLECILKKQKAKGALRKDSLKEIKKLKSEYKFNEKSIDRQSISAMRTATKRNKSRSATLVGWISLILLVGAGLAVYFFRAPIWEYIKGLFASLFSSGA